MLFTFCFQGVLLGPLVGGVFGFAGMVKDTVRDAGFRVGEDRWRVW